MIEAYIGLGSNLDQPEEKIKHARAVMAAHADLKECKFSSLYRSPPMGPQDQPDYVNAVICIQTDLAADDLLTLLQKIEHDFGRVRKDQRWGERTLDLDILLYGEQEINTDDLVVPHYGIAERAFVLYPLKEIAEDDLFIPGKGHINDLFAKCPLDGLEKIE